MKYEYIPSVRVEKSYTEINGYFDPSQTVFTVHLVVKQIEITTDDDTPPLSAAVTMPHGETVTAKIRAHKPRTFTRDIIVTDKNGLYLGTQPEAAIKGMSDKDYAAFFAASLIRGYIGAAIDKVQAAPITDKERTARINDMMKAVKNDVLYRGDLRQRSRKGFERLLFATFQKLYGTWKTTDAIQAADEERLYKDMAPVRRQVSYAYTVGIEARSKMAVDRATLESTDQGRADAEKFIREIQEKTREAALMGATGSQKSVYLVIAKLVNICRRNGGKIDGAEFLPTTPTGEGATLRVSAEKFLTEMGYNLTTADKKKAWRLRNEVAEEIKSLRARAFTIVKDMTPDGRFKFETNRNLFGGFDIITRPDNVIIWQFSGLSIFTLPISIVKGAPFADQYDRIPIQGIQYLNATYRHEIADAACSLYYYILMATATRAEIYDFFQSSDAWEQVLSTRCARVLGKIYGAVQAAGDKDGIEITIDRGGIFHARRQTTALEQTKRRALAAKTTTRRRRDKKTAGKSIETEKTEG